MIAPHELKNKTFTRSVRGYTPQEVDEYFDFLIEKYTEAYKASSEWEQKYNSVQAKYAELSNEEESIRSAILKAQKLGEVIVENAKKEAKELKMLLKGECDAIVAEAKEKVQEEKENLTSLRKAAILFQDRLYEEYVRHISLIKEMNLSEMVNPDAVISGEELLKKAEEKVLKEADVPTESEEDPSSEPKENE